MSTPVPIIAISVADQLFHILDRPDDAGDNGAADDGITYIVFLYLADGSDRLDITVVKPMPGVDTQALPGAVNCGFFQFP